MDIAGRATLLPGGPRLLSLTITAAPASGSAGDPVNPWLGDAALTGNGNLDVGSGAVVDGHNTSPPGWAAAGLCAEDAVDAAGADWVNAGTVPLLCPFDAARSETTGK